MMPAAMSWEELRRQARAAERELEENTAAYSALNKAAMRSAEEYDEENPPTESTKEKDVALKIEMALTTLSETIDAMSVHTKASASKTQDAVLQRYRELYFDFKTEYRRTMGSLQEKRETHKLFGNRQNVSTPDSEVDSLLNERRSVDSSRVMASSIIDQALEAKNALDTQRARFMSSRGKANTLANSFSGIHSLMEQIRRKKMRNNTIIALVIAGCICFTLWWTILSHT